jgi:hypothetical protein
MSAHEPLPGALRDVASVFENCVVWAVRAILESDVKVKAPFVVVNAVPDGASLYCILPTGNYQYHAQLVVGAEEEDIARLFPSEADPKVRKDAIGELANVISGLFVADEQFISRFGYLKPSTPFFSEGAFSARKDWGLEGHVVANGREIALYFSVREQENPTPVKPSEGSPG